MVESTPPTSRWLRQPQQCPATGTTPHPKRPQRSSGDARSNRLPWPKDRRHITPRDPTPIAINNSFCQQRLKIDPFTTGLAWFSTVVNTGASESNGTCRAPYFTVVQRNSYTCISWEAVMIIVREAHKVHITVRHRNGV